MIVIGLAGPARAGKTTAAMHLVDAHGFGECAFAEPIKRMVRAGFGLDDAALYGADKDRVIPWLGVTPRRLFQTLGTEWGRRQIADDLWLRLAQRWLDELPRWLAGAVFSDVRTEAEAEWVRRNGGHVIHLRRPGAPEVEAHETEAGVAVADGDLVITNAGAVAELHAKLDDVLLEVAGGSQAV